MIRELAGIYAPCGVPDAERVRRALGARATTLVSGPLAVAFTGGHTPPAAGRPLCVVDGELYDARELADELGLSVGTSTEQLVTAAWRARGEAMLDSLRGSFTLLLWDPERERGLLARDQLGSRSLFVHQADGVLRFASEVRLLLSMLPRRPAPDSVAVVNWLARGASGRGRTMYESIRPLGPGRLLMLQRGTVREWRYWEPWRAPLRRISREEAAHDVRQAIRRAIARRTVGRPAAAVEVSGGLDSASVAAFASQLATEGGPPVRAYSGVFPAQPDVDESPLIEALVHELGIPSVRMAVDRCAALAPGLRFLQEWELPLGPANHFVWEQLLRREAAEGIQLTLNGQGGDELFGAPVYLFADRIAHGRVAAAYELTRRIPGVGPDPPASIRRRAMRLWGLRGALPHRLHLAAWRRRALERHAPPLLSPEGARVYLDSHDPYPWKRTPGPRWRAERLDLLTDGADGMGVFDYLRRRAAGAGVESREPLLDVDLIGLMMRIPPELSFDPALSRPVLREAVGALLPDSIRLRSEKSAFDQVLTDALTGADLPALRHILGSPSAEVRAWVRPELVRETVLERPPEVHPGGADGWSKVAWRLLGLECWLRTQEDASFPARALDSLALEEPRCTFRAAGVRVPAGAR